MLESICADGLLRRTLMEQREMRWSLCLLRSEIRAKPGKWKTFCFSGIFSCNEKCSVAHWKQPENHCWSVFAAGLIVIPCLQNRINELQWSISSAKSTSCRFWWESNLFIPSLFVQSSVHSVFHAFCVYFCSSSFWVSELCLHEGFDSGFSVQYSSRALGMFLWAEDVRWTISMAWLFSNP